MLTWTAQSVATDSQGHVSLTDTSYEVDYVLATEPGHPSGLPQATGDWLWRFVYTTSTSYSSTQNASGCNVVPGSGTLITRDIDPTKGANGSVTTSGSGLLQLVSMQYTDSAGTAYTASGGARA